MMASELIHSYKLSLKVADEIANKAISTCVKYAFNPISVCVMDGSGYPIVQKCMVRFMFEVVRMYVVCKLQLETLYCNMHIHTLFFLLSILILSYISNYNSFFIARLNQTQG